MYMTKNEAKSILNVPEGATKEEIKQVFAKIALTTHPDQKSSTPETTKIFETVSLAYKRLQQMPNNDWVELSTIMEQFSTVFRFRMKTENGYVYFMYNPFTGLPDSDSDDGYDDYNQDENGFNNLLFNNPPRKQKTNSLGSHRKIIEVDREKFEQMNANAKKNAQELINEEDKAKDKAKKKKEKRLRQKEKKKTMKKNSSTGIEIANFKDGNSKQCGYAGSESSGSQDSELKPKDKPNPVRRKVNISGEIVSGVGNRKTSERTWKEKNSLKKGFRSDGSDSTDHDEEWDEDSAFVAKAFKNLGISKKKPVKETSPIKNEKPDQKISGAQQEKARDVIALSRQLAMQGNQLAGNQNYEEAVRFFTKAISLFNNDCRYYGNRSYCYDRLELYERALQDANTAISLSSLWAKGYFRKGRALAGLERYVEAEKAYEEVLKLDRECFDAEHELKCVRLKHLMDMGFSKNACEAALKNGKTISLALEDLLPGNPDAVNLMGGSTSDEDEFIEAKVKRKAPTPSSPSPSVESEASNPNETFSEVDYNSLWIGNMTPEVTEQVLRDYFSQFGHITGVSTMYDRRCAFVNFASTEASKAALLSSDTVTLHGAALVIRYPDRAYQQAPSRISYKSKRECFYWRNRGCHFGSACRYLHVEANKGIDLQTVERTPYRSTIQY